MSQKKHRLSKVKRWEMRREILSSISQGFPLSSVIDAVTKKYDVNVKAAYRDWARRKNWIPQLAKLEDPEELVKELLLEMHEARINAWTVYRQALKNKNENAAVGALKHVAATIRDQIEILQSLGKVTQAAQKVDAFITTTGHMPWEDVPDVKIGLDKLRKRLAQEKAAADNVEPAKA